MLVASYQYEIPRASTLFGGNKAVGCILDNWRISGISTFGTGGRGNVDLAGHVTYSPNVEFTGGGENCGSVQGRGRPAAVGRRPQHRSLVQYRGVRAAIGRR